MSHYNKQSMYDLGWLNTRFSCYLWVKCEATIPPILEERAFDPIPEQITVPF